ncbi:hypothetical protein AMAG_11650 [Allomyces macrogynus ATCC 38327]|uniref:Uncharacterized protein n=1 Tax=Allomyces macrogynus (strain ATCC 38327) TaxID=578462 RepID=A0A0L0SVI3_ALLM3|nr:hypothetical protein AMAG_11650 [Allomyces macrogynus ATCC 38327]|eukprot:KNE66517.1 hypothetical protein AMAG_11650 [Allomyces macrogynus ATCC 38327]
MALPPSPFSPRLIIETPRVNRILRPLKGKLAYYDRTVRATPSALRSDTQDSQPPARAPSTTSSGSSIIAQLRPFTLSRRRRQPSRLDVHSASKIADNPLRSPTIAIHDGFRDVLARTSAVEPSTDRLNPSTLAKASNDQPRSLKQLAAFALGRELALQQQTVRSASEIDNSDGDEASHHEERVEDVCRLIPAHLRRFVLQQHATELCIYHAHSPAVLVGLFRATVEFSCPFQFMTLVRAIFSQQHQASLTLSHLETTFSLANHFDLKFVVLDVFCDQLSAEHALHDVFLQFASRLAERDELDMAMQIVGHALVRTLAPVRGSALDLVEWVRKYISLALATMRVVPEAGATVSAMVDAATNSDLVYCVAVIHAALAPSTLRSDLRACRPLSLALLFDVATLEQLRRVAERLHQHGLAVHAVPIAEYLLEELHGAAMDACARWIVEMQEEVEDVVDVVPRVSAPATATNSTPTRPAHVTSEPEWIFEPMIGDWVPSPARTLDPNPELALAGERRARVTATPVPRQPRSARKRARTSTPSAMAPLPPAKRARPGVHNPVASLVARAGQSLVVDPLAYDLIPDEFSLL